MPTALSTRSASMSSMDVIHFIRCTWKRPQGSRERRGGPGSNGLFTYQDIGADAGSPSPYIRSRGEGEAAVQSCIPWRSYYPPGSNVRAGRRLSHDNSQAASVLPAYPIFGDGRTRLQPAVRGRRCCGDRTSRAAEQKAVLLSTNWPVRASIHTRSCCGPLPVPQDCGQC